MNGSDLQLWPPRSPEQIDRALAQHDSAAQYAEAAEAETAALGTYGVLPTANLPAIIAVRSGLANYGAGRFFTATAETVGWQR